MAARSYRFVTANSNNLQQVPGSASKLIGASLINTTTTVFYVKFWWVDPNGTTGPTVGTTPPDFVIAVPPLDAAGGVGSVNPSWPAGLMMGYFSLWVACVTGAADNDNTSVAAGAGNINLLLE